MPQERLPFGNQVESVDVRDEGIPSANAFAQQIESMVWDLDVSYLDAILLWCERRGLEPENVATLIKRSGPLKAKVQIEAEALRLLPSSGNKLPI